MDIEMNKQWHQSFYGAMEVEFSEDFNELMYDVEHYLCKDALHMDLLLIKKFKEKKLKNEIGAIFKTYNIFEYKNPKDSLNIDDYYKTISYACLYKSQGKIVDEIKAKDITVTLVREGYPRELIRALKAEGKTIIEHAPGIYYVEGGIFSTQIIVTGQLGKEHVWLRVLTDKISEEDAMKFANDSRELDEPWQRNALDVIYQVSVSANMKVYDKIKKEDEEMCEALKILLKPEIEQMKAEAIESGLVEGRAEGRMDLLVDLVKDNIITLIDAAKRADMSVEKFKGIYESKI